LVEGACVGADVGVCAVTAEVGDLVAGVLEGALVGVFVKGASGGPEVGVYGL
jgi:hypothetical protein